MGSGDAAATGAQRISCPPEVEQQEKLLRWILSWAGIVGKGRPSNWCRIRGHHQG
jgi:hypothetical protein